MRSIPMLGMSFALVGCVSVVPEPRGGTMKDLAGEVSLVFTNASPEAMCELNISPDGKDDHGDNWLPPAGLPSGKSLDFQVKPGKYKAMWATCKRKNQPYFAATRWRETAFEVVDATQLFAFVASNVAPTSIAPPREHHRMVRFAGQAIDPNPARSPVVAQPQIAAVAPPRPQVTLFTNVVIALPEVQAPVPELVIPRLDPRELSSWIDPKLVAEARARAARNPGFGLAAKTAAPAPVPFKPSAARGHDVGSQAVGYKMR